MKTYELIFITENDSRQTLAEVENIISKFKGNIKKKSDLGKKKFAYKIKKQTEGHYFSWIVEMPEEETMLFKKTLSQSELVLRILLLLI